jgi:aminoglycoside phosphotransferase family enzyme/predicted kinase
MMDDALGSAVASQTTNLQDDIFKLLEDPATFGGAEVRRCDTHAAAVFLAGESAIKVKRAVSFPFLDYSTLEKRKAACLAELDVNRRFAPQLYRRVLPITRESNGSLAFDGAGEPVEWAVEMTRFDENKTLDHLVERDELDDRLTGKLGQVVASMHERALPVETAPWLAAVESFIEQNTAAFHQYSDLFPSEAVAELDRDSRAALTRLRPMLSLRGGRGLIRRGHGDLHLGNIAVLDGEPVAFDALEFDPIIASGDVLYDLAFLLMDLVERGCDRAANLVLNSYYSATRRIEDCEGVAALPFFMSLRAAIRAKVTAARLDVAKIADRNELSRLSRGYFDLGLALLKPAKPVIFCIGGLSGTGKSVLARSVGAFLPPSPGALVFRSDVERKAMFGIAETEHLAPGKYQAAISEQVYQLLIEKAVLVMRAGHSVIVDAVFGRQEERAAIENAVADASGAFHGVFLVTDLQTRIARIRGRGPDASDADISVAQKQEEFSTDLPDWTIIDASGSPQETLAKARQAIGSHA